MSWLHSLKIEHERQILGLCMEVSPLILADMLKPDNFSNLDESHHAEIYKIITGFPIGEPVNIMTVSQNYKRKHGDNLWSTYYITGLVQGVYASDPRYYAMKLLELDIRTKLIKHLEEQKDFMTKNERYEQSGIYKQCIELIDNRETDLFEGMEICHKFISNYIPEEAEVFEKFIDSMPKVANRILTLAKIENACQQFESLCGTMQEDYQKEVARQAKDVFIMSCTSGKLSAEFIDQLYKLHQTI